MFNNLFFTIMTYNQTKANGVPMPLLMGCTKPSTIEIIEEEYIINYDPLIQMIPRPYGTKSLKIKGTAKKTPGSSHVTYLYDKKNEIDDTKYK